MSDTLDMQIVNDLVDIMGDDIGMLYETFISDSESKLDELRLIKNSPDADQIRRLAHSLKGSSKNVGASTFAQCCASLEAHARENNLSHIENQVEAILTAFENTKADIIEQSLGN